MAFDCIPDNRAQLQTSWNNSNNAFNRSATFVRTPQEYDELIRIPVVLERTNARTRVCVRVRKTKSQPTFLADVSRAKGMERPGPHRIDDRKRRCSRKHGAILEVRPFFFFAGRERARPSLPCQRQRLSTCWKKRTRLVCYKSTRCLGRSDRLLR